MPVYVKIIENFGYIPIIIFFPLESWTFGSELLNNTIDADL